VDEADGQKRNHGAMGFLKYCRYLLHDRDGKFCLSFDEIIESGKVKPISYGVQT
jgi:hypothetical protein